MCAFVSTLVTHELGGWLWSETGSNTTKLETSALRRLLQADRGLLQRRSILTLGCLGEAWDA